MSQDNGKLNGQFAFPKMNVRAADAGHFGAHERGARFERGGPGKFAKLQGRVERFEDGRFWHLRRLKMV